MYGEQKMSYEEIKMPTLAQSQYNLVQVLVKQERWQEAIEACGQVIELDPVFVPAYQTLGELLNHQGDWEVAVKYYQKAIELKPDFADFHHGLGLALSKLERWKEATEALSKATKLKPDFSWSHNSLGEALLRLKRWEEATVALRRAIELNPDFAWSYFHLGEALSELKDWDGAAFAFKKAMELDKQLPSIERKLGDVLHKQSYTYIEEALQLYRRAIEQNPSDFNVYHKLLEVEPSNVEWYFKLGEALENQGQLEQAVVFYDLALQKNPEAWEKVIKAYSRIMGVQPEDSVIKEKLSKTYTSLAQFSLKKASENYRLAIEFDQDNIDLYSKAIAINNQDPQLHLGLAKALIRNSDRQGAIDVYPKQKENLLRQKTVNLDNRRLNVANNKANSPMEFDWYLYLECNPDLSSLNSYEEAHHHWLNHGKKEGRVASESQFYRNLGLQPSDLPKNFNWQEYLELNKDVKNKFQSKWQVIKHFLTIGFQEGRLYSFKQLYYQSTQEEENFDWQLYLEYNPDLNHLENYDQAYEHWLNHGQKEGRIASESQLRLPEDFDWQQYLEVNPDLRNKIETKSQASQHYLKLGIKEGRLYKLEQWQRGPDAVKTSVPRKITEPITSPKVKRIAVLVHIYYYDLWPELRDYLNNIKEDFDLFVNVVESIWKPNIHEGIRRDFPDARILITKNRGKDVGGQLASMGHLDFDQYDLFCLIHTKKSPHVESVFANQWRKDLIGALLGSEEKVRTNLEIMRRDPRIGVLGSRHWRNTEVADNSTHYYRLLDEFDIKPEARACEYVAGTMMFVRPQVMKPIYEKFGNVELEDGDNKDLEFHKDGQIAHSLERIIGNLVKQQNLEFFWQD